MGFTEAPRGALGHWGEIENGVISGYQCVVPTTWNAAPRSDQGQLGAYEAALRGTKMAVPEQPLEILRTIHSFDPCLACATHVMSDDGNELAVVSWAEPVFLINPGGQHEHPQYPSQTGPGRLCI